MLETKENSILFVPMEKKKLHSTLLISLIVSIVFIGLSVYSESPHPLSTLVLVSILVFTCMINLCEYIFTQKVMVRVFLDGDTAEGISAIVFALISLFGVLFIFYKIFR